MNSNHLSNNNSQQQIIQALIDRDAHLTNEEVKEIQGNRSEHEVLLDQWASIWVILRQSLPEPIPNRNYGLQYLVYWIHLLVIWHYFQNRIQIKSIEKENVKKLFQIVLPILWEQRIICRGERIKQNLKEFMQDNKIDDKNQKISLLEQLYKKLERLYDKLPREYLSNPDHDLIITRLSGLIRDICTIKEIIKKDVNPDII